MQVDGRRMGLPRILSLQLGVPSEVSATSALEAVSAAQPASASAHMTKDGGFTCARLLRWGYKSPGAQGSIAASP